MKNYSERTQDILSKAADQKRKRRRITAAVSTLTCLAMVICLSLVLFLPQNSQPVEPADQNKPNDYSPIAAKLSAYQKATRPPVSFWDMLFGSVADGSLQGEPTWDAEPVPPGSAPPMEDGTGSSVEVTDLQVAGVGEADLFKRTEDHIFYLRNGSLYAYSIAGEQSAEVGYYPYNDDSSRYYEKQEMFLSPDGTTVTILTPSYNKEEDQKYTLILNLDVRDPANMKETGRMYVVGNYQSSRLIGGALYVFNTYAPMNMDFSDPTTFIPTYGTPEEPECIPADQIYAPEELNSSCYTVVSKLDAETLEMVDSAACLSYSSTIYVSQDSIYLTRNINECTNTDEISASCVKTEITRLSYDSEKLDHKGSTIIDGSILNQYSMDQKDDILRVVTTIDSYTHKKTSDDHYDIDIQRTASLYCIDLANWETVASVEAFAPQGEEVRSVRFDGDIAYVCTSIQRMDPVFFFDLSDLDDITYKDTGTIDGFSLSLVDFAPGYLMGIGFGESTNTMKIEIYREGDSAVECWCKYELDDVYFSQEYKGYYIDRENKLVGLAVHDYAAGQEYYLLLRFDGYELVEVCRIEMSGDCAAVRGVYIDEYFYVLGESFAVENIG